MKIGILTLPLYINYGGILQAYALQTILERQGHVVEVIKYTSISYPPYKNTVLGESIATIKRIVKRTILGKDIKVFNYSNYVNEALAVKDKFTQPFIEKYIHNYIINSFCDLTSDRYDGIVVGSDQIWRHIYFTEEGRHIEDAFLNFAKDWNIKRMAYAASFGKGEIKEYTEDEIYACKSLIQKFDFVGVREESGVNICTKEFHKKSVQVLDPTLLLHREDYEKLVKNSNNLTNSKGNLFCYLLNKNKEEEVLIKKISKKEGLNPFEVVAKPESSLSPLDERVQQPVEQWIKAFMDARLIVTDSFHACVFSILFNKPFIVVANNHRGVARIDSLLKMFGLGSRLQSYDSDLTILGQSIDWEEVNEIIEKKRIECISYFDVLK